MEIAVMIFAFLFSGRIWTSSHATPYMTSAYRFNSGIKFCAGSTPTLREDDGTNERSVPSFAAISKKRSPDAGFAIARESEAISLKSSIIIGFNADRYQ